MSDLIRRLTAKAAIMEMGEPIAWGSALMRDAAAELARLTAENASLRALVDRNLNAEPTMVPYVSENRELGSTEMVLRDCLTVWERMSRDVDLGYAEGDLVAIRLWDLVARNGNYPAKQEDAQ